MNPEEQLQMREMMSRDYDKHYNRIQELNNALKNIQEKLIEEKSQMEKYDIILKRIGGYRPVEIKDDVNI